MKQSVTVTREQRKACLQGCRYQIFNLQTFNTTTVSHINFDIYVYEAIDHKPYPFVCNFPGSSSVKHLLSRKKRAVSNTTTEESFGNATSLEFIPVEANFSLIFTTTGCRTWTDDNNSWTMEGCTVNFVFRLHLSSYSSSTNVKVRKKEKPIKPE